MSSVERTSAGDPGGIRPGPGWGLGRAAASFATGLACGAGVLMVGFGLAMTAPRYILPAVLLAGVLLSVMRWPAVVGAAAFLIFISDEEGGFYVPLWMPVLLAATWAACRGVRAIHRELSE